MIKFKGIWKFSLLALALGAGTWLVLRVLGPASLPAEFPVRPDLKSSNAALRELIETADAEARSHPDSAEDIGRLGMAYHANQFHEQAEKAYAIASRLAAPKDYRWIYYRALLAEERGQETAQASLLEKALELQPGYLPALQKQGDICLKQGNLEKAAWCYEKVRSAGGGQDWPQAAFGSARIAGQRGDWVRVIETLEPVIRNYPQIRPAHQLLAEAYEALKQHDKAAGERAVLLEPSLTPMPPPDDPLYQKLVGVSCSSTRLLKEAGLFTRFGRSEDALRIARRATQVEPGDADVHHFLAKTLLDWKGGDPEAVKEALVHLNEGLRLRPDDLLPLFYFATFFFKQEKTDVAVEELRSMLLRNPTSAEANYYLGVIAGRGGRTEEAVAHYQAALRIDPKYAEPCDKMGQILLKQGQVEQAIEQFRMAVDLKPSFIRARCNLGVALEQQGRIGEAVKQYREALSVEPNDAGAQMYLAIALLRSGNVGQAIAHFRNAVRITPQDPEAHYGLGFALAIRQHQDEARREFQEALRLRPDYAEARQELEKLNAAR